MTFFVIHYIHKKSNTNWKENLPIHSFQLEEGELIKIEYDDESLPRALQLYFSRNVMNDKRQEILFIKK